MSYLKVSEGGLSSSIIDVKKIAKSALDVFAHSVIMFHNHPSGNLKPSKEDIGATEKVKSALNLFDVRLLDHLILTDEESFSFNDEGIFIKNMPQNFVISKKMLNFVAFKNSSPHNIDF